MINPYDETIYFLLTPFYPLSGLKLMVTGIVAFFGTLEHL